MPDVWVLSEESPFEGEEESGGCVSGVFTTASAALFYLGTTEIGPAGLAEITWTPVARDDYEGRGHGDSVYILCRHPVQDEDTLRTTWSAYVQRYDIRPEDQLRLTTEALRAMLTPGAAHESEVSDATDGLC